MIPKQAGYFGDPFRAKRGVRQGDVWSPLIFNLIVDAVIRHNERLGVKNIQFHADDGFLWGESSQIVQSQMDLMSSSLASLGLKMNAKKTEFMAMIGNTPIVTVSDRAFNRKRKGEGLSHREYSLENGLPLVWFKGESTIFEETPKNCQMSGIETRICVCSSRAIGTNNLSSGRNRIYNKYSLCFSTL